MIHTEENLKSVHKRIFKLGDTTLEEVQSVKHVGVELSAFSSSEHRIKTVCNKSHNIIASLSTAGLRPKGLHPMVSGVLWNKLGISAVLFGSEVWYGTTKTDILKLEKAQIRKLKLLQGLPMRTHDYVVRALLKQHSIETMIDSRKLQFLHKLVSMGGLPHTIFLERLYSSICNSTVPGFIGSIAQILRKYHLHTYLRGYMQGKEFPTKSCWKILVKESISEYERTRCRETLSVKNDVQRFLRIMGDRLYKHSFPYYTASMQNIEYAQLLKLTKLVCLPTYTVPLTCELCGTEYHDVVEHIFVYCPDMMDVRDSMWEELVNTLDVEDFVDLWNKPDDETLDILLGAKWRPLRNKQTRQDFLDIMCRHTKSFYAAVQRNLKWLK